MKTITYLDKHGGVWPSLSINRRGLDFRRILQEATGIERAVGGRVTINFDENGRLQDVTDWIHKKALEL